MGLDTYSRHGASRPPNPPNTKPPSLLICSTVTDIVLTLEHLPVCHVIHLLVDHQTISYLPGFVIYIRVNHLEHSTVHFLVNPPTYLPELLSYHPYFASISQSTSQSNSVLVHPHVYLVSISQSTPSLTPGLSLSQPLVYIYIHPTVHPLVP